MELRRRRGRNGAAAYSMLAFLSYCVVLASLAAADTYVYAARVAVPDPLSIALSVLVRV